jgi:hypothetical protein
MQWGTFVFIKFRGPQALTDTCGIASLEKRRNPLKARWDLFSWFVVTGTGHADLLTTFTADCARFRALLLHQSQIESETRECTKLIEEIESLINSKQPEEG